MQAIKLVRQLKIRVILIITLNTLFINFTETLKRRSLGSKYDEMNDFCTLLNAFINAHKATAIETRNRKNRIMVNVKQLYNKYFNTYKKKLR